MSAFIELLEAFEASVSDVEAEKADTKSARRAVKIVEELAAMDLPVMVEVPDVSALRAWLDSQSGADLSADAEKIQQALDVADFMELSDDLVDRAVKALERYRALTPQGSRYLSRPITMVLPDGKTRRSNKGDWTSIRNQANKLTDLSKEELTEVRDQLRAGRSVEVAGVRFTLG